MQTHDIVFFKDEKCGRHRFWEILGIYLGAEGQESLVQLRSLSERPGKDGRGTEWDTTTVPECLLRNVAIYTPDNIGVIMQP